MNKEEILEDVKRHIDYLDATNQFSIRDNEMKVMYYEIERLKNIIEEQDKELELERKSRQLLTDDLANVCEMSLKKENIINGMEKFFKYAYDNEVKPLNDRKISVWTICLDKLQELKGSDSDE